MGGPDDCGGTEVSRRGGWRVYDQVNQTDVENETMPEE